MTTAGIIKEYSVPTGHSDPKAMTLGPDRNYWFVEYDANKIGRMTPQGVFTEFAVPTFGGNPIDMVKGPDGNLWFTEYNSYRSLIL